MTHPPPESHRQNCYGPRPGAVRPQRVAARIMDLLQDKTDHRLDSIDFIDLKDQPFLHSVRQRPLDENDLLVSISRPVAAKIAVYGAKIALDDGYGGVILINSEA